MTGFTRRTVVTIGGVGLAALAGCTSLPGGGESGPQERTFEITIREENGALAATIEPQSEAEGVIQVNVGDDVTFTLENTLDHGVGVHNHVTDQEVTIEAGSSRTMEFTPTEEQVGRHELEAFESDHQEDDHGESEDGHDENEDEHDETETDHDESEDDHGGTSLAVIEVRPQGG